MGAVAVVVGQWATRVAASYDRGITSADSLGYHLPWAARFVQTGDVWPVHYALQGLPTNFDPANAQVLTAITMLPFGNDVLAPLLNLGWLALALLAAWCAGQRWGAGAVALVGLALVAATPILALSQPGQSLNDLAAIALLLAAVALLAHAEGLPGPTAIAGLAAGLALGTKLNVAVPIAVLTISLAAVAIRARRWRPFALWAACLGLGGGFWLVRNLVAVGSPLPQLALPFFSQPRFSLSELAGHTTAEYLTNGRIWQETFRPGLRDAFGLAWPVLGIVLIGGGVASLRLPRGTARAVGAAALAAAAGYIITPGTAFGLAGHPVFFRENLRIAVPALALGAVALAAVSGTRRGRATTAVLSGIFLVTELSGGVWPAWPLAFWGVGLAAAITVAGAALAWWWAARAEAHRRRLAYGAAAVVLLIGAAAGHRVQQRYLDRRYAVGGTAVPEVDAWARSVHGARIAAAGYFQQYPLYGLDLSNHVQWIGTIGTDGSFERTQSCAEFRREVANGGYDYVVVADPRSTDAPIEAVWISTDSGAREVLHTAHAAVFRIVRPPNPQRCA